MYRKLIKGVAVLGATAGLIGGSAALANAATGGGSTTPTTPSQPGHHHCQHPGATSGASYGGGSI